MSALSLYRTIRPLLFALPPESAHSLALFVLKNRLVPRPRLVSSQRLATRALGLSFPNPVGLAAGFDKDARALGGLFRLGFGFVEAGAVTPRPQPGNPRPRLFRLVRDEALINRMGFNNEGLEAMAARLATLTRGVGAPGPLGVNLGVNRDSAAPGRDYAAAIARLAGLADFLTLNLSSPNTPGLAALQRPEALDSLLAEIAAARAAAAGAEGALPLLVKLSPDLEDAALAEIAEVLIARGIDGVIMGNTSTGCREGLASPRRAEPGGLSGRPLKALAERKLASLYRHAEGRLVLVGVGGIGSGEDAYRRIRAGASLVQMYTALVYHGPGAVARVINELAARLAAEGIERIADIVGRDAVS